MTKKERMKAIFNMVIDEVMNPKKYEWIVNAAGPVACAEYLYNNHWDELRPKVQKKIESTLVKAGILEYIK